MLNWIRNQASSPIFEDTHESFSHIFMAVPGPFTDLLKGFMDHRHSSITLLGSSCLLAHLHLFCCSHHILFQAQPRHANSRLQEWRRLPHPTRRRRTQTSTSFVVISQTHWLVSQVRLPPMAGTTLFILYTVVPSVQWWF